MSGGAGYVLSHEALDRFVQRAMHDPRKCLRDTAGVEDVEIGQCLASVGVAAGDSRDDHGRDRFHPFPPDAHLIRGYVPRDSWYWSYNYYPVTEVCLGLFFFYSNNNNNNNINNSKICRAQYWKLQKHWRRIQSGWIKTRYKVCCSTNLINPASSLLDFTHYRSVLKIFHAHRFSFQFLPCDAMCCTVFVIIILSVCLSVCQSVRPSVTLVDCVYCSHGLTNDDNFFTIW